MIGNRGYNEILHDTQLPQGNDEALARGQTLQSGRGSSSGDPAASATRVTKDVCVHTVHKAESRLRGLPQAVRLTRRSHSSVSEPTLPRITFMVAVHAVVPCELVLPIAAKF